MAEGKLERREEVGWLGWVEEEEDGNDERERAGAGTGAGAMVAG